MSALMGSQTGVIIIIIIIIIIIFIIIIIIIRKTRIGNYRIEPEMVG